MMTEPAPRPCNENIIIRLPQYVGTFGLIPLVILGYIGHDDMNIQHIVSVSAILLGALLTILYFIADLYPYTRLPKYDKVITCGAHTSSFYMVMAAIMYSWLHRDGIYIYYTTWLLLHSCLLLFPCIILLLLPQE
jgi:hypothetical protein